MLKLPGSPGPVQVEVTPQMAGWRHLTFRVHALQPGQALEGETADEEAVLVLLEGAGDMRVGSLAGTVERRGVFRDLPRLAYVPRRTPWSFQAARPTELAWGSAPAERDFPARILGPSDCPVEMRGGRNVTRQITHLADPGFCQRLLCVEVYTPSGNWSSYPPHKHDADRLPEEVDLDEVYYYRMPPDGWAVQRLYEADFDELFLCRDRDTVVVRKGYHPVVAAPGFDVYYLNVLAGEHPLWITCDDPELAWVRGEWNSREPLALPLRP
ncbi:MAG: 5-deoxy-glucuronate isomerase [Candidatus Eremiobacterota bacterium]